MPSWDEEQDEYLRRLHRAEGRRTPPDCPPSPPTIERFWLFGKIAEWWMSRKLPKKGKKWPRRLDY